MTQIKKPKNASLKIVKWKPKNTNEGLKRPTQI